MMMMMTKIKLLMLLMQGCQKAFVRWLHTRIIGVITVVSALTILQVCTVRTYTCVDISPYFYWCACCKL